MTDGEWLPGNVGGAWRVGDTVHRTVGPWTPAVHALLNHVGQRISHVPQVLGFDDAGREVLTFLPGEVIDVNVTSLSAARLTELVAWTRAFHEAVVGFDHPGPWRNDAITDVPTIIGHNDIAPYNVCLDGDALVGVFDWDLAGPTTPLLELAFLAWNSVPLWRDVGDEETASRLQIVADAYGSVSAEDILQAVPVRIEAMVRWIPVAAAQGDEGMRNLMKQGEPERSLQPLRALVERTPRILALL